MEADEGGTPENAAIEGVLSLEGVRVALTTTLDEGENEFTLITRAWLDDMAAPFELEVVTGSRFDAPDPPVGIDEIEATLLFMTYPYLREVVSNITGRSPYESYSLPPLAKLPHQRVTDPESDATV